MGVGGAEGLANSVNVLVGIVEAPLFIRPYLDRMTRSELFSVRIGGMSTMAPGRRNEIVELGLRAVVSGTLTSCMIGSIVGAIGA